MCIFSRWAIFAVISLLPSWLQAASFDKPQALFEYEIEPHVMVTMRDGIQLATDIYRPLGVTGRLPTIVIRTPYNRKLFRDTSLDSAILGSARFFVGQGYAVVVQDARGKYDSEGVPMPMIGEATDGFDTVEWIAKQPWSSGKVGSYGCSYLGESQIMMAQNKPPHLTAMIPQASGGAVGKADGLYRYFGFRVGGARSLISAIGWFHQAGSKVYFRYPEGIDRDTLLKMSALDNTLPGGNFPEGDFDKAAWVLPLTDIPGYLNSLPNDFHALMTRELNDPWWEQFHYIDDEATFNTPALHVDSWYNGSIGASILQWQRFKNTAKSKQAKDNQFLLISPATHCRSESLVENSVVGERPLGDARFAYWQTYLKWFAYWLKGEKNAITDIPKVQYYLMGDNQWRSADRWPPKGVEYQKFYLHSEGKANSRHGDGVLNPVPPDNEPADQYIYDPATPIVSRGGAMCCTGNKQAGSFDQSDLEMRNDMLVYTTPVLDKKVTVTGPIEVTLYVSSSAKDTDFIAKLIDVYPDGRAFNIQEGILRARYREGMNKKVFMQESGVYEIKINLQATANAFLPGHRIRLQVMSSNFPAWDRNLNTGGNNFDETEWVVAKNKIHHSKQYPSHIVLPIQTE